MRSERVLRVQKRVQKRVLHEQRTRFSRATEIVEANINTYGNDALGLASTTSLFSTSLRSVQASSMLNYDRNANCLQHVG
jgi:hypothetical protein